MKPSFALICASIAIMAANLLAGEPVPPEEISLDEIIERVKTQQSRIVEEIEDAVFLAEAIYRERKKNSELEKELLVKKNVYMRRGGGRHEEYLGITRNGSELYGKELEKEIKDWRKKSRRQQETKMPLTPEGEGTYDYHLIGSGAWNDREVWVVEFRAKQQRDGYINGKGYVSKDTFNIVRAEFSPAKISRVIEDMKMALTYSEVQGYWMPALFQMSMRIKVGFLVDFFYREITIEEKYTGYQFNNQLMGEIPHIPVR